MIRLQHIFQYTKRKMTLVDLGTKSGYSYTVKKVGSI
jgi:hypothetical protein